jgi:putative hydrolase of the HAD superfamily
LTFPARYPLPLPAHIIFDLDDTIVDYSSPAERVWKELYPVFARKAGVPVEQLQQAVDESRRWYWSDLERFREGRLDIQRARRVFVRAGFEKLGLKAESLADEMADRFSEEREIGIRPFDGAIEALEILQAAGAAMVLLTNGESRLQRAKIKRFSLERFFKTILIEGETGVGKPDPRAHQAALASLRAAPDKTWMVGDDLEFDVRPAKTLGMRAAWIRKTAERNQSPADVTLPSIRILVEHWENSR